MRKALTLIFAGMLLSGCSFIYRQPVNQGTLIEQKSVEQLKEGMSHQQVLTLLGTPSVTDPFHPQRWDYVASERVGHGSTEVKTMTLWFDGDSLTKWDGEYFPDHNGRLLAQAIKFGNLPKDKDKNKKGR